MVDAADLPAGMPPLDGINLPPFASEYNKQLDREVKDKQAKIEVLNLNIDDNSNRIKVMTDHLSNVQQELVHTQQLVDAKKKEMDTENHMIALAMRQIGRIQAEIRRLNAVKEEYNDRTNAIQTELFSGNEKLDQFKLKMNWNQEELEQWALAARQKEEDELALETYKRQDEMKIRDLTLEIERITMSNAKKRTELDNEVTETQAQQIVMEKVAEQFRGLHEDRKTLIQQWEDAVNTLKLRDEQLEKLGIEYAEKEKKRQEKEARMKEKKKFLEDTQNANRMLEANIANSDRNLARIRLDFSNVRSGLHEFKDNVDVLKNQVGAAATEQANEKNKLHVMKSTLEERTIRLSQIKAKLVNKIKGLEEEKKVTVSAEEASAIADKKQEEMYQRIAEVIKDIKFEKDDLYKESQELYKLRNTEAAVLGEIAGTQSGIKNLQFQIKKLDQERQRQQEILYSVDFQSQLMQRKVARASGERSLEERADLNNRIEIFTKQYEEQVAMFTLLTQQNKRQLTDVKNAIKLYENVGKENRKLKVIMEEVELQTSVSTRTAEQAQKQKEQALVHHDAMKLEVKRLRTLVNTKTDSLCSLENRKEQLQISMEERAKEIEVHQEVLRGQLRVNNEENHRVAIELSERKQKLSNLKAKYETVVTGDGEHSQAYYVLKAAQQKEELQRKGDLLDSEIHLAEREVRALENSLGHLVTRNQKFKENFKKTDEKSIVDMEEKRMLEEQSRAANEVLFKKKKQLQQMEKDKMVDTERMESLKDRAAELNELIQISMERKNEVDHAIETTEAQLERAAHDARRQREEADSQGVNIEVTEKELELQGLKNANAAFKVALSNLMQHPPYAEQLNPLFQSLLQERRINW